MWGRFIRGRCADFLPDFFNDEDAQTTVEYVMILAIMVALAIVVMKQLILPIMEKLRTRIGSRLGAGLNGCLGDPSSRHSELAACSSA